MSRCRKKCITGTEGKFHLVEKKFTSITTVGGETWQHTRYTNRYTCHHKTINQEISKKQIWYEGGTGHYDMGTSIRQIT